MYFWPRHPVGEASASGYRRLSMNRSMYSADRTTHLKIVLVALAIAIAMANLAIDLVSCQLKNRYGGRDQDG
jgi:hypothetical protein